MEKSNTNRNDKKVFAHKGDAFIESKQNRMMLKNIEEKYIEIKLKKNEEYMTLYATVSGIIMLKHQSLEEAIIGINNNKAYYRQAWHYDKEKGAYDYVADFEANKEIEK